MNDVPTGRKPGSRPLFRRRFVVQMALREGRGSLRRLWVLVSSIAVGVAALVAINSFTRNVEDAVKREAAALTGADLVLSSTSPFSIKAEGILEGMARAPGAKVSRVARFAAMAFVERAAQTRLVQVTAVSGGYPFYGAVSTDPKGLWAGLESGQGAIVDAALLTALDARVGDSLILGEGRFPIAGTLVDFPGDVAVRSALGPRVFIPGARLGDTRLIGFGSRVRYEAYVKLPESEDAQAIADKNRAALADERVFVRTVAEQEERTTRWLGQLGRYLGLVALVALLLGGLGVSSAVHVYIKRRLETLAVLRCLGATSLELLAVYVLQASALGLAGSLVGVLLGALSEALLPFVLGDFLPVGVETRPSALAMAMGLGIGAWVSVLFAALPLLALRDVSPLLALRRPYEEGRPSRRASTPQILASCALVGSVLALAILEAGRIAAGVAFALGVGLSASLLALAALLLTRGLRRFRPRRWPYVLRQGIANLFRPANQTVMVVLVLGFGAFLLDTLVLVEHNLLRDLLLTEAEGRPNVALFDIQPDQRTAIKGLMERNGLIGEEAIPIVPMRIESVNGERVSHALVKARPRGGDDTRGALRREYRSTYRDHLQTTERTVAGALWRDGSWRGGAIEGAQVPISVDEALARELQVSIGSEIVWDVQGVEIRSKVVHLRSADWTRFEPNFMVVFPLGPLNSAPQTYFTLTSIPDAAKRARFERQLAETLPNVSALDVSDVQRAVQGFLSKVALAIRFMALFSLVTGAVVLLGAVLTSRYQRARETVLLKTLGATRSQLLKIALAEYSSLGALASATAALLSTGSGWSLMHFEFERHFSVPWTSLLALSGLVLLLSIGVGLLSSLDVLRRPPLEVLRAE